MKAEGTLVKQIHYYRTPQIFGLLLLCEVIGLPLVSVGLLTSSKFYTGWQGLATGCGFCVVGIAFLLTFLNARFEIDDATVCQQDMFRKRKCRPRTDVATFKQTWVIINGGRRQDVSGGILYFADGKKWRIDQGISDFESLRDTLRMQGSQNRRALENQSKSSDPQ